MTKRFLFSTLLVVAMFAALATAAARPSLAVAGHPSSVMSEPQTTQRQQIVDAVKLRLKKIDSAADPLANGYQYQTDIGKNPVERWRTNYSQDELKAAEGQGMISIFDLVRTREAKDSYDQEYLVATLPIQMRVFHFRDLEPEELTKMLADMQQAAVTNPDTGERDLRLGGLAIDIKPGDDGFIIPNEVFTIEGGAVSFDVEHLIEAYGQ
jgi:hypothetical protein